MSEEIFLQKLESMGITLPPVPVPVANYLPFVITGHLLFLSGQGPMSADGAWLTGKLGANVSVEQGYVHARLAGLRLLSVVQFALGSLDRVERVVKILGLVNSDPGFENHPQVINGCSDLMVEVFGERGRHARSAVGVGSLPDTITVEIEGIFEIRSK